MRVRNGIGFVLATSLLVGLSCAPVDGPIPEEVGTGTGETFPSPAVDPTKGNPEKVLEPVPEGLKQRIESAIKNVRSRQLTMDNGFWTIFHGILGLGPGLDLMDTRTKEKVVALDFICKGGMLRGLVFRPTLTGVDVVSTQDSVGQGHQDQFIAEMAQWGMPADRKMIVGGKEYTFLDFVNHSQARASLKERQELSWTIVIVSQYKGTNAEWVTPKHEKLHLEDIVRYELAESIENAACGGTHRLFGLSWAYHLHLQKGGKVEGVWKGIPEKTARYRDQAKRLQNPDGSFSTQYFKNSEHVEDKNRRINTTGHILEWLALALNDEELRQPWVQDAVNALCLQILDLQGTAIDGGSMYHAAHGLLIYYARVFGRSICPKELYIPLPPGWKQV